MTRVMTAALVCAACVVPAVTAVAAEQGWRAVQRPNEPVVTGSGRITSDVRRVPAFERVDLNGMTDVEIRVGGQPSLAIVADDNLLTMITSKVIGGTLVLDSSGSYRTRTTPRAIITTPTLKGVSSSGSGSAEIIGVMSSDIALASNGSGNFRVTGTAQRLDLSLRGTGNADLSMLATTDARAEIYGTGMATVRATGALQASVFGPGTIRYLGTPKSLSSSVSGPGRIVAESDL